jgi:ABC-type amino acid transport substrate-binding protein
VIVAVLLAAPRAARADDELGVGLFTPSAPFGGTSARLDYVTRLADRLGASATGKTYSRASDFAAAIKNGDLDVAVVDAPYLAALGVPYTVLAIATRGGDADVPWLLVSRGGERAIVDLAGKKILCTTLGGREDDFVYDALLGGELKRGFFASVDGSPDVVSVLASLGLGRADAAVVPSGVELPAGVSVVATLPSVSWPALVALPGASEALRKKVTAAATGFDGGDVLGGFVAGGSDPLHALARRFAHRERRGPMVIPSLRVTVDELVETRPLAIPHVDLSGLLATPASLPDAED